MELARRLNHPCSFSAGAGVDMFGYSLLCAPQSRQTCKPSSRSSKKNEQLFLLARPTTIEGGPLVSREPFPLFF